MNSLKRNGARYITFHKTPHSPCTMLPPENLINSMPSGKTLEGHQSVVARDYILIMRACIECGGHDLMGAGMRWTMRAVKLFSVCHVPSYNLTAPVWGMFQSYPSSSLPYVFIA